MCHSRTRDLPEVCRRADVLVAAVGRPRMIQGDWVKPGATVIDVGINRTDDGLVGDVDFDAAAERAARITPVPARRRPDDDRDAAAQHAPGGEARRRDDGCATASGSRSRGPSRSLASLFLHWYGDGGRRRRGDRLAGVRVLDVVLVLLALVPLALFVTQATRSSPAIPVFFSVMTIVAGLLATLLILYRIVFQPGANDARRRAAGRLARARRRGARPGRRLALRARRVDARDAAARPVREMPAPAP